MKVRFGFVWIACLLLMSAAQIVAQDTNNAAETAQKLRGQLSEVKNQESDLKMRLEQLNYDLKPENIERHFAGYGSTRPEELREARRRQLQTEKDRIVALLTELDSSRLRLEVAITQADAKAYQQSALGVTSFHPNPERRARFFTATRVVMGGVALGLVVGGFVLFMVRRRRQTV